MKLFYHVMIRLSLGIILVLAGWAVCFYYVMVDEINDEIDDSLEDYSELVIIRMLAGEELPSNDSGSNNQYYLSAISKAEAMSMPSISLRDSMVYIAEKGEEEPARILTSVFCDDKGEYFKVTVSTPTIEKKDLIEAILHQLLALFVFLLLANTAYKTVSNVVFAVFIAEFQSLCKCSRNPVGKKFVIGSCHFFFYE